MGTIAIFTLIASLIGTMVSAGMAGKANQQNYDIMQEQKEFNKESAATANATTVEQYQTLYSPQAKVQQFKEAGLNPALMYNSGAGGGGTTAAQASPVSAPVMNPLLQPDFMNKIVEASKTATETKKTEKETNKIESEINKTTAEISKIEKEIEVYDVSKTNTELNNEILRNNLKVSNATLNEQIENVRENLKLIKNTADEVSQKIESLKIENNKKSELLDTEIAKLQAEQKKLVQEELLVKAQILVEQAKQFLTENQNEELKAKLQAIETYGYLVVNGSGWQDRAINSLLSLVEELDNGFFKDGGLIGKWLKDREKKKRGWSGTGDKF